MRGIENYQPTCSTFNCAGKRGILTLLFAIAFTLAGCAVSPSAEKTEIPGPDSPSAKEESDYVFESENDITKQNDNRTDVGNEELPLPEAAPTDYADADTQNVPDDENIAEKVADSGLVNAIVTRVIDGDTVDVRFEDGAEAVVRMIGIDTPESTRQTEPYGKESTDFTRLNLLDKTVYLEKDVSDKDRFNRLLRYIWLREPVDFSEHDIRSNMFNAILLLEGFAQISTHPPNIRYVEKFTEFQKEAREVEKGLWGLEQVESESKETLLVGSSESTIYHLRDCRFALKISQRNLIEFTDSEDAQAAGYEPCEICRP